ncbi:hypothetical protein INR49_016784 [Caranx melampygus]|nr:hypothetical protein INR49_016784 [Caranx melampygus]
MEGHAVNQLDIKIRPESLSDTRCPDKMEEEEKLHISSRESSQAIFLQVLPSYLLAGLGLMMAGILLDQVQLHCTGGPEE